MSCLFRCKLELLVCLKKMSKRKFRNQAIYWKYKNLTHNVDYTKLPAVGRTRATSHSLNRCE